MNGVTPADSTVVGGDAKSTTHGASQRRRQRNETRLNAFSYANCMQAFLCSLLDARSGEKAREIDTQVALASRKYSFCSNLFRFSEIFEILTSSALHISGFSAIQLSAPCYEPVSESHKDSWSRNKWAVLRCQS